MLRADHCRFEPEPRRGRWSFAVGAVLCAGLVGGLVSPAWAAEPPGDVGEVQLGSFALGDALEASIGELDGAFGFTVTAGGLQLGWDSRAAGTDAVRLGDGWSFGLAKVRVTGGVWVHTASGGAYQMSASSSSGLAGYPGTDVVFAEAEPGAVVPARADGSAAETPYAFVLHELGGVSTYFDAAGNPVAKLVVGGDRLDWRWEAGDGGRLLAAVSPDGSVTSLDWSDPSELVIQPGSNVTDPVEGSGAGGRWVVGLEGGRVSTIAGPAGGSMRIAYDRSGLVERVQTPSGSSTAVEWQASSDGVARVARVRQIDEATGAELSVREWGVQGEVAPSGWPFVGAADAAGAAAAGAAPGYEAWLSDGKTRVDSNVDAQHRLTGRAVAVTVASGERVLQEQAFEYAGPDGSAGAPASGAKPVAASITYHGEHGATRSASESYVFDELGRMVERRSAEGATMRRTYDPERPSGRLLPIGLVTEETTTTADGLVSSTRSELSEDRSTVVASETWSARDGGGLVRTGRVESDVEQGVLTEQRVFPGGDPAAVPVVTRWSEQVDLPRGTKTVVQTDAAGTGIESSTTAVSSLVHGGVLSATDEVGNVTSAQFDEAGREVGAVDATGRSMSREYLSRQVDGQNAVRVTAGTGVVMTQELDVLGRLVRTTDNIAPSGRAEAGFERVVESVEYDVPGVERVTDAWGAVTTTERDVFGRVERVVLPNGLVQVADYDDVAGSATSGVSLTGELADAEVTSTTTRDAAGTRMSTTGTRADGVAVPEATTEFDGFGRTTASTVGEQRTTTDYDVAGNAIATNVAAVAGAQGATDGGVIAERRFDAFGVSVEKTLRADSETYEGQRRELDELGRVVSQSDQRGVTERTSYTADGLVAEVVSDTGRVESFEYDPRSRAVTATRVSSPHGATVETAYRYDEAGVLVAVFDPADEAGTTIRYESDDFGNRTLTVYPDGSQIRHEFDANGRKTATVDVEGNRTEFTYDETDGALVRAAMTDRHGAPIGGVRYTYDEYARVSSLERDNGVRTDYTFTSTAQVETEVTTGPEGVLSEREYAYAPAGTLTSRVDRVRNEAGQLEATRTEYEYDLRERLTGSTVRAGDTPESRVVTRTEYVPTVGGDLASETLTTDPGTPEAVSTTRTFEYSAVGELTGVVTDDERRAQQFDAEGSLVAPAAGGRYEYDAASRPVVQVTADGVRIDTRYWADGSRRERATETGSTRFYWDGVRLLNDVHETAAGEHGTASYLIGTSRQARTVHTDGAAVTSYYGTDRHGNVTELLDQAGAIATWYRYSDYGVTATTGEQSTPLPAGVGEVGYNPFQYAAEYTYRDGTQPLGPRTYDAAQARFLTEDDAPLANLYAFGDLNPITNIDPSGRASVLDWGRIGAVGAGLFFAIVGAAAFIASIPTGGLAAMGFLGALTGGIGAADAVVAGMELGVELGTVHFDDKQALEIASWSLAAASVVLFAGGLGTKVYTRYAAKLAALGDEEPADVLANRVLTRFDAISNVNIEELRSLQTMKDVEFKGHLTSAIQTWDFQLTRLSKESDAVLKKLRSPAQPVDAPDVDTIAQAPAHSVEDIPGELADLDASIAYYVGYMRRELDSARTRLTALNTQSADTNGTILGIYEDELRSLNEAIEHSDNALLAKTRDVESAAASRRGSDAIQPEVDVYGSAPSGGAAGYTGGVKERF